MAEVKEDIDETIHLSEKGRLRIFSYRVGDDTPAAMRNAGLLRENYYSAQRFTIRDEQLDRTYGSGSTIYSTTVSSGGGSIVIGDFTGPQLIDVLPSLVDQWRNTNFNLGVTLGEGKESAILIADAIRAIAQSIMAMRRGNFGDAMRHLWYRIPRSARRRARRRLDRMEWEDAFLEMQYGWRPMIQDVYDASQYLRTESRKGVLRSSKTFKRRDDLDAYPSYDGFQVSGYREKRLHVKLVVANPPTEFQRLGLDNPALIAWELVSLSFVVDWFSPISSFLESVYATGVFDVVSFTETYVDTYDYTVSAAAGTKLGPWTAKNSCKYRTLKHHMTRFDHESLPSALSYLRQLYNRTIGDGIPDLSLRQMAEAVALLTKAAR